METIWAVYILEKTLNTKRIFEKYNLFFQSLVTLLPLLNPFFLPERVFACLLKNKIEILMPIERCYARLNL